MVVAMAGDWIPMRKDLEDDPTVVFMARAVKLSADHIVGKLHKLWSWADSHSTDGHLAGIDADYIDHKVGKRGFARAMSEAPAPWLAIGSDGVTIINFSHWFGTSAKRRLSDTRRKQAVRILSADCPQDERTKTGLQNRTEENRTLIAPAQGAVDWNSVRIRAKQITKHLGDCGSERNKRLLLGACVMAANGMGDPWLETAVRETREAHANKPYAYLRTILAANSGSVDFKGSIAAMEFPVAKPRFLEEEGVVEGICVEGEGR